MTLIVGLGNPGKEYEKTRHNVGFMTANLIAGKTSWKKSAKAHALFCKKDDVEILKPIEYMNLSGPAVAYAVKKHLLDPAEQLFVIHDDLDLPVGAFRISRNRSSAGHKGVQSIIDALGSKNFTRFRIGIKSDHPIANVERFVLSPFNKTESAAIQKTIASCVEAIEYALANGAEKTASVYNSKK